MTKIFLAVVALFAYACVTDTTEDLGVQVGGGQNVTEITLSLEESRTQLGEKVDGLYPLYWSSEDKISVNGVESAAAVIDDSNPASATFTVAGELATPYCIAYPAAPAGKVIFAENQEHAGNGSFGNGVSTMYAYSNGGGVTLNHLTGVLKIGIIGNATLAYAQISNANRLPIAGTFDFDFEKGEAKATDASKYVINYNFPVTADAEGFVLSNEPQYIHVAVPAGVYDELYVTLYDKDGGVMYATVKADDKKPLAVGKVREFSNTIVYAPNESVFVIKDVASLKAFAAEATLSTKDALFVADVDMTGEAWTPIESYAGTVHGNGYSIKGLTSPLFGTVYCSIKGLHLVDVNIEETKEQFVGALARHITSNIYTNTEGVLNDATVVVENCSVSGKVVLNNQSAFVNTSLNDYGECVAAGLIGRVYGADVNDCVNKADVEVKQFFPAGHTTALFPSVGGVAGYVSYCNQGGTGESVKVISNLNNLVNYGNITVADSSYTGETNVTKYSPLKPYIGGVVGCAHSDNKEGEMHHITNRGDITLSGKLGNGVCLSGTFGYIGTLNGSHFYNHGKVTVKDVVLRYIYIGAGVGYCGGTTVLDNVHNYGAVTVEESATCGSLICGGLIAYQASGTAYPGEGHGSISNSTNNAPVTVLCKTYPAELVTDNTALYYRVGGLAGWTQHYIDNCNNLEGGKVTCTGTLYHADTSNYSICVGGLVGYKTVNPIDNSRNDADLDINLNMTTAEGYDLTKVRLNLGGISGYTNLPCRNVTNNGKVDFYGDLAGQLRIGGVFAQGNTVSANLPQFEKCVNNGEVVIKSGSKIGDQLMIGGVAAFLHKNTDCTNNGTVTIEDNVSWSATYAYIGGAAGYTCGTTTNLVNNAPLTIGKGCSMGTAEFNYIGGALGQLYADKAEDLENTAKGVITIGESDYTGYVLLGGCMGTAPAVKTDGKTKLNVSITNCRNYGAINYYATHSKKLIHYVGGCLGYIYEVSVSSTLIAPSTDDIHNYGPIYVKSTKLYDLKMGGVSSFLGGPSTNIVNHEGGTIHVDADMYRIYFAGVAQCIKDSATDIANYGDITIDGHIAHTLYGAGCITINNNYTRTRNSNHGDITVNAQIDVNNFIGGLVYDSGANLTYVDCHNTGNFTLGEKAVVNTQTRWGGFVGKLEKNAKAGKEVYNIFNGCSNSGDIIIKGTASDTQYTSLGGIYGSATGNSRIIILNGFTNSGDIIFEGTNNGVYVNDDTMQNRNFVTMGGLFGVVASSIVFSNEANPSWTGNVVNTGTIKFAGTCKNAVQLGGFAGYLQGSTPTITDGQIINLGDIVCTGTYDPSYAQNGIGGIAGHSDSTINNAKVHCLVEAVGAPNVGMVTGSERTEATLVSSCEIGGTIAFKTREGENPDTGKPYSDPEYTTITGENFQDYIYAGETQWQDTNYDSCSFLSVKPTI
ncbi:MAG: hypothetical protein II214_06020 [Alistipes sp.]|nr:hypothetical protein [Alistipes sp.]